MTKRFDQRRHKPKQHKPKPKRSRKWERSRIVIPLRPKTRERLKKQGTMGDTFDSVINRLLDFWNKHH